MPLVAKLAAHVGPSALALTLFSTLSFACAPVLSNFQMGVQALDGGDDELAETHFQAALDDRADANRAREQLDEIWLVRARAYENLQPEKAAEEYRRLLIRDPAAYHARMRLGAVLEERLNDTDGAIEVLAEAKDCRQCAAQAASMRSIRGQQRLAANDFAGAAEDLQASADAVPDALAYLALVRCFAVGGVGTPAIALANLNAAYPLVNGDAKLQDQWTRSRADYVRAATKLKDFQAARDALAAEDPRVQVDITTRSRDTWTLTLEFAAAEQAAGNVDDGLAIGQETWDAIAKSGRPVDPALRAKVVGLYMTKIGALTRTGNVNAAVRIVTEARQTHPDDTQLMLLSSLVVAEIEVAKGRTLHKSLKDQGATWRRTGVIIDLIDARKMMENGDNDAAHKLIVRSQASAPELLETRLAYSQWLALADFEDLSRKDKKLLARDGLVKYDGAPSRSAQALAELSWVKGRFAEANEQQQPLRMPGFAAWIERLEASLRETLPYDARKLPGEEPRLIVENTRTTALTVEVSGPGVDEAREIAAGKRETFVFEEPGLVQLEIPEGARALLAETGTAIVYSP